MSQYHFKKVRELKRSGLSRLQITEKLGMSWATVSKYYLSNSPPEMKKREYKTRVDPSEPYKDTITNKLENIEEIQAVDIFEMLTPQGYTGSLRTIERRVSEILGSKPKERFFEQEYKPAEQTQFDFKESVELPFKSGTRAVNLHYGTLPYSGKTYIKAYPFLNYECFLDGIHSFFEHAGGLTENIRIDNLAPCIKQVLKGRLRKWTEAFQRAIDYYGFGVLPCTPAKGNEKGHVERDIRTFTRRIKVRVQLDGIIFTDWDDLNKWLLNFIKETQTALEEKYQQEKLKLLPLPKRNTEVLCKIIDTSASKYGTVRISRSVYSVPDCAIDSKCKIVADAYTVKIFRANKADEILANHPRKPDGEHSILLSHVITSLIRKPQAMIRWVHREMLFPEPIFKNCYHYLLKLDKHSAEREFLRIINLIYYVDLKEIAVAMQLVIAAESIKPFDDVRELLLVERRPCPVIDITELFNQHSLKPRLSDYDSFIPKTGETTI